MLNSILPFVIFMLIGSYLHGQQPASPTIKWGEELRKSKLEESQLVHASPSSHFVFSTQYKKSNIPTIPGHPELLTMLGVPNKYMIERYDSNLSLVNSLEFPISYQRQIRNVEKVLYMKGRLLVFTSFYNKKTKKYHLFMESIQPQTLRLNNDIKMIAEFSGKRTARGTSFSITHSDDTTKILVSYQSSTTPKASARFGLKVIDEDLEVQFQREAVLPYPAQLFYAKQLKVGNMGKVYIKGFLLERKAVSMKNIFAAEVPFQYIILTVDETGPIQPYKISIGADQVRDLSFQVSPNGDLICAGLYSEGKTTTLKGSFFAKISAETGQMSKVSQHDFPKELLGEVVDVKKRPSKSGLPNYQLRSLINRPDGGAVLLVEQYTEIMSSGPSGVGMPSASPSPHLTQGTSRIDFQFEDILVINIDPDGNIKLSAVVNKFQSTSTSPEVASFFPAVADDQIFLIYNDHKDNLQETAGDRIKNFTMGSNAATTLVIVNSNGNISKMELEKGNSRDVYIQPGSCIQFGEDELIIYAEKNKKFRWGRLKIE